MKKTIRFQNFKTKLKEQYKKKDANTKYPGREVNENIGFDMAIFLIHYLLNCLFSS